MDSKKTTAELQKELDELLLWFESDQVELDEAVKKYERGAKVIELLQERIKTAENTIKKITKS